MAYASSSRTTLGRESVFPLPPSATSLDFLANLEECFRVTRDCSEALQRGVQRLQPGTHDLPRLTKILEHKHRYLVLPQPTVHAHKSALGSSLAPQVDQLITRAESAVESEKARVARLEERLSILQAAQLPPDLLPVRSTAAAGVPGLDGEGGEGEDGEGEGSALDGLNMGELTAAQRRRVVMLRGKRQRLEKEKRRLMGEEE